MWGNLGKFTSAQYLASNSTCSVRLDLIIPICVEGPILVFVAHRVFPVKPIGRTLQEERVQPQGENLGDFLDIHKVLGMLGRKF